MSKNIVFIIDIKKEGKTKIEYKYSIDSWNHFCKKYNHELLIMDTPVIDPEYMGVIWQRYFLFDILELSSVLIKLLSEIFITHSFLLQFQSLFFIFIYSQ